MGGSSNKYQDIISYYSSFISVICVVIYSYVNKIIFGKVKVNFFLRISCLSVA